MWFVSSSSPPQGKRKKKKENEKGKTRFSFLLVEGRQDGARHSFCSFSLFKKKKKKKMEKANDESWYGVEELVMVNLKVVVVYIYLVYLSL